MCVLHYSFIMCKCVQVEKMMMQKGSDKTRINALKLSPVCEPCPRGVHSFKCLLNVMMMIRRITAKCKCNKIVNIHTLSYLLQICTGLFLLLICSRSWAPRAPSVLVWGMNWRHSQLTWGKKWFTPLTGHQPFQKWGPKMIIYCIDNKSVYRCQRHIMTKRNNYMFLH